MPRIPFESFEISLSNGFNLESKALSPFRMVRICIRILLILSNGSNFISKPSSPFRMVQLCIRMPRIPFEKLEFAFDCLESLSKVLKLDLKASNPFRMI